MTATTGTHRLGGCNLCEAMCGLTFTVDGGAITSTRGDSDDPLSRGHLCPKALALGDLHADPDRLRRPIKRVGTTWVEIGWDEAFDLVADGLVRTRRTHGPDAVGVYWGNPMAHSLGALTHGIGGFSPLLGTRNRFSATSLDTLPHFVIHRLLYGHQLLAPVPDIDRTQYFLIIGSNPLVSNGSTMTVPDIANRLKALRNRGGTLVVVDPRRTETARIADRHLYVRPGTDALFLLAVLRSVLVEDRARARPYVDSIDAVAEIVEPFTPEVVAPHTGMSPDDIRAIAHDFAAAPSAVAHGRMGVSTQQHGALCQWAIQALNIVTGNLDSVGGALVAAPAADLIRTKVMKRGELGRWRSRVRGLPEFGGELPTATMADEIVTPGPGQIRSLVVMAGNPVLSSPNGSRLDDALLSLDFMVAFDFYVNETTRHADVILPPAPAVTRDHYDLFHHHFAVRNTSRFTPAVIPKAVGEKHDWEIYRDVALRYRRALGRRFGIASMVESVRLRMSPVRSLDMLLRLSGRGVTLRKLRKAPHGIDLGPLTPSFPQSLHTPDKRIDLLPELIQNEITTLGDRLATADVPTADQLLLIGRRHLRSNNSWMHNAPRLVKGAARHHLLAHPSDLAARGLAAGDTVCVTSASGEITIEVDASDDLMPGVVSIPHGYGHRRGGVRLSVASTLTGPSANDLTDETVTENVTGAAVFNGVPVTMRRVADPGGKHSEPPSVG
ncbi:oxidoreductase [Rhodococcoides trifolii]|uniref:Oxidoreductase n=1 Tax=Rhodococcoides trifolii TaxID=908250 RepID=A0A917FZC7_9NOCA|nr:molybdopterin-dependent oxidoreductase [Rhodococcus trifolii]GGG15133.1 oxidoreductase [Rhodococcus trifolii]